MISKLRKTVAGPKNRTKWEEFDMDFTYISDRIVAMAFPASGIQKAYRNSINEVAKYLHEKHNNNYLIINVSNRDYNYVNFSNRVQDYPWNDHQAPTIYILFKISNDVLTFLRGDSIKQKIQFHEKEKSEKESTEISLTSHHDSIVCFHCNHGKGRTGTAIIAFFLYAGFFKQAEEARAFYNKKRFSEVKYGVDQPCQLRYLQYFEKLLTKVRKLKEQKQKITQEIIRQKMPLKSYYLKKIYHKGFNNDFYINVSATRDQHSKHLNLNLQKQIGEICLYKTTPLFADLYIEIWRKKWNGGKKVISRANINLFFLHDVQEKDQMEGNNEYKFFIMNNINTRVSSSFENAFQVTFIFELFCDCHLKQDQKCLCEYERQVSSKQWDQTVRMAAIGAEVPITEACKLLYIPYEVTEEEKSQEVKQVSSI